MADSPPPEPTAHLPAAPGHFWSALGQWLDSAGVTQAADGVPGAGPVPNSRGGDAHGTAVNLLCPNCPICQGAALFDRIDWQALADVSLAVANLLAGVASALLDPDVAQHPRSGAGSPPPERRPPSE
ncbi:MAG: hypothetical protein ACOYEV_10090 [Candidatus Nanopelagicales bacterium]